ncbi:MAG: gliding motility-associated lipoprotein GldD [Limisphaerales bacterium]|jgi:gliding motility-associated lipoprotein GldD
MIKPLRSILSYGCLLSGLLVMAVSCAPHYSPKPRAYPRVHYPLRGEYQHFQGTSCPFHFMLPDYYKIVEKKTFFGDKVSSPCWGYNLDLPSLNGTLYLTYKKLDEDQDLLKLSEEAYRLTYKHARKADYIEPVDIRTSNDVFGLLYYVGGDAASALQFFATDTTSHFIRGTLNFKTQPNADSLAPIVHFVSQDLEEMLNSLTWE